MSLAAPWRASTLALMSLLALALSACQLPSSLARPSAGSGQAITISGTDPITLDPALVQDRDASVYVQQIFSGLVTLDKEMKIVPDIAEKWSVSPDGRTYTFQLRGNARFSSGKPVTAGDFVYSITRATDPKTQSQVADVYLGDIVGAADRLAGRSETVQGLQAADERTLRVQIDSPKAYFISKLTYPTAFAVNQPNTQEGKDWAQKADGTGPFKIKSYRKGERLELVRNDNFYDAKPRVQQVTFVFSDGEAAMNLYERGELEMIPSVGLADIQRVTDPKNPLHADVTLQNVLSVSYLGFNTKVQPFEDVKVRRAFSHAIDKDKLARVLMMGTVTRADGIVPPGMPGYQSDVKPLSFDVARAKALIAESTYKDVKNLPPIALYVQSQTASTNRLAAGIAAMLRENLGIDLQIRQVDWETFLSTLSSHLTDYQVFFQGWVADYPDPEDFIDVLFRSKSQANYENYSNPEVDRLVELASGERDQAARYKLYEQAEQIIVEDAPWVPLWFERNYSLKKPYLRDAFVTPLGTINLRNASVQR